jgi:hypothetical protein
MGTGPVRCFLGFSVAYSNTFSEHLEQRSSELDRAYRQAYSLLLGGLDHLHDAVDAALGGDAPTSTTQLVHGLDELEATSERLTIIGEGLVRTRSELFERSGLAPSDPLVAREEFFSTIDYDGFYRELSAHGAALPGRAFWDDVVERMRDGGARAGLRLLDRHLRELQSDLRSFIGEVESMRRLSLAELPPALHGVSLAVASLTTGFTRLLTTFTYFSLLCERASLAYERAQAHPAALAG